MKKGFALVATTIITSILLGIGVFFISFSTTDLRIARAHAASTRSYYLSESATSILVHKITNNPSLAANFIQGNLNSGNSQLNFVDIFDSDDSFDVYAVSVAPGEATIFSTSDIPLGETTATRATTTDIVRATGTAITDYSLFGNRETDVMLETSFTVNGGIVFSNDDIDVKNGAVVTINNGSMWAHDDIRIWDGSTVTINNGSLLEGTPEIEMPAVDFNSSSPTSWKNRATILMNSNEFDNLPDGAILEGIIYVNGSPKYLRRDLTVYGMLIIQGNFEIEKPSFLQIFENGGPSGLLVKNVLEIENDTFIEGLVYASERLEIEYDTDDTEGDLDVNITGAIMSARIEIEKEIEGQLNITITHDEELISRILTDKNNPELNSPTIDVGHWEEEY